MEIGRRVPDAAEWRDLEGVQLIEGSDVVGATGDERPAGIRARDLDDAVWYTVQVGGRVQIAQLIAEDEIQHRVPGGIELRHQDRLEASAGWNRDGQKLIGLIQERTAVAGRARAGLEVRGIHAEVRREVLEEATVRASRTRVRPAGNTGGLLTGERKEEQFERAVEPRRSSGSLQSGPVPWT